MEKDYSLLRPFDLDKAKAGEHICWHEDATVAEYIGPCGMSNENDICVKYLESKGPVYAGKFVMNESRYFRMAPLAWVEGKPVYKGDALYRPRLGPEIVIADRIIRYGNGNAFLRYANGKGSSWVEGPSNTGTDASWAPPKVKHEGWVNIFPGPIAGRVIFDSETQAKFHDENIPRIACVRIEWEE